MEPFVQTKKLKLFSYKRDKFLVIFSLLNLIHQINAIIHLQNEKRGKVAKWL